MRLRYLVLLLIITMSYLTANDSISWEKFTASLSRDKIVKLKNYKKEIVLIDESNADTSFFRLGNGFSKKERETINPILDKIHYSYVNDILNFTDENSTDNVDVFEVSLTHLSKELLGFNVYIEDNFSLGGHPRYYNRGYLYSLSTGEEYGLDDILTFSEDRALSIRDFVFKTAGERIAALEKESPHCNYSNGEVWDFTRWNFRNRGIAFMPKFSYIYSGCEEWILIPFSKLEKIKKSSFSYDFKKLESKI